MDETVTLNNGAQFNGHVLESGGVLFVYLNGGTLADYFSVFNTPNNVEKITEKKYDETTVYTGYELMYYISEERGNRISIGLRKTSA